MTKKQMDKCVDKVVKDIMTKKKVKCKHEKTEVYCWFPEFGHYGIYICKTCKKGLELVTLSTKGES